MNDIRAMCAFLEELLPLDLSKDEMRRRIFERFSQASVSDFLKAIETTLEIAEADEQFEKSRQ